MRIKTPETAPIVTDCYFCGIAPQRQLAVSDRHMIVLCNGPVIRGHVLLANRTHVDGVIASNSIISETSKEAMRTIRGIVEKQYGACTFIEHGNHHREAHCSHGHMHVLPIDVDCSLLFGRTGQLRSIPLTTTGVLAQEYVFVEGASGNQSLYSVTGSLPPRHIRRVLLQALRLPEIWIDYVSWPRPDTISETDHDLRQHFEAAGPTVSIRSLD
jgi:diadenosine tetraphosphate (Ap4A) HIT family hydrolase